MKRTLAIATALTATLASGAATAGVATASHHQNIVQVASANPQFSTLVSLVKKAGLVGALSSAGPYTVFAPTNAAFARVPRATLDRLAANPAQLKAVLLYHVVKGKKPASAVVGLNGRSVRTLQGKPIRVKVSGGSVLLNDTVRVTRTDVQASNGVIHVVNNVLIPPTS